jgi:transcriptional regulator with XRE-family HTH domain
VSESLEQMIAELRAARLRHGMAQADVAARIGTTQSAVARLESGNFDARIGTVQRYADAVGMRLDIVEEHAGPSLRATATAVARALAEADVDGALREVIQFLDDVKGTRPERRREALVAEPDPIDRRWDALLAAVAEYASHLFGFAVPGWASAPGRFLDRFWFVVEDLLGRPAPGLAALAYVRAPAPFANRGVFLDADTLVSV